MIRLLQTLWLPQTLWKFGRPDTLPWHDVLLALLEVQEECMEPISQLGGSPNHQQKLQLFNWPTQRSFISWQSHWEVDGSSCFILSSSMSPKNTHPQWPPHHEPTAALTSRSSPKRPAPAEHLLRRDPCHRCTRKTTCGLRRTRRPAADDWGFPKNGVSRTTRYKKIYDTFGWAKHLQFIGTGHLHLEWLSPGSHSFVTMLPLAVLPLEQVESSVRTFFLIPESHVLSCIHCLYF